MYTAHSLKPILLRYVEGVDLCASTKKSNQSNFQRSSRIFIHWLILSSVVHVEYYIKKNSTCQKYLRFFNFFFICLSSHLSDVFMWILYQKKIHREKISLIFCYDVYYTNKINQTIRPLVYLFNMLIGWFFILKGIF